ncbi:MAG: rod shape-determining protein MreC [Candidatus Paceibacteria bacterium]
MSLKNKNLAASITVVFFLILGHFLGWLTPIEGALKRIINPVSKRLYSLSVNINNKISFSTDVEEIKAENRSLRKKIKQYKVKQSKIKQLKQENRHLKKTLNFFKKNKLKSVGANVIGKDIQQTAQTLVLDKGSSDGVKKGNPVIVLDGAIVGKIAQVSKNTSIVRLLHDSQSKIAGTVLNKDKSIGLVEGGFGINLFLNYIPQNEQIYIGDTIVTSGLDSKMPRGLAIGEVEAIEESPYQPFQRAVIKPIVDLSKVTYVSIITSVN